MCDIHANNGNGWNAQKGARSSYMEKEQPASRRWPHHHHHHQQQQQQPQPQIKHKQQQQQEEEQDQEGKPANISNISSRRTYGWQNQDRQAPLERNPPCCTATSARLNCEVLSPITILWVKTLQIDAIWCKYFANKNSIKAQFAATSVPTVRETLTETMQQQEG